MAKQNLAYEYDLEELREREADRKKRIAHESGTKTFDKVIIARFIVIFAVAVTLLAAIMYGRVELSSLYTKQAQLQAELEQYENENKSLESELAQKTGLTKVEAYAEDELGLQKLNKSQIESAILSAGRGLFKTDGVSMNPLIKSKEDLVLIESKKVNLKKNDVALFKRKNGDLVLHRIVKVNSDGYIFRGDNQCFTEGPITDDMIIGVAKGIYRNEEFYSFESSKYKRYLFFRKLTYPFRKLKFDFLNLTNRI